MSMLNFLRNNEIVKSKEDAIALLNSSSVMDIAGDGTLIEARYSDEDKIKTIFALYHISEDSKTATIYDSEAHIEPDAKINEKITNITKRLDKVDGGSSGSGTPGEPSLIDKVTNLVESVGDKTKLATTDKTNLVNAINETFKKIGTIPVLVEAQLRLEGDYNVDKTTGKITDNTSFKPSENDKEGLVITFLSRDSNDKPEVKSVFIDFEKIFIESEVGNGLNIDANHKINVNIDKNSEKYLSVSSSGLKFVGLDAEIQNRENADTALGGRITTESNERKQADATLDNKIITEIDGRKKADTALGGKIDAEVKDRKDADTKLGEKITTEINTLKTTLEKEIRTATGEIDLSDYVTNETLEKNYQTTADADGKYQPKGEYATKTDLGNKADKSELANYQKKGNYATSAELKNYLTTSVANNTYATKTELTKDYYNKSGIDTKLENLEKEIQDIAGGGDIDLTTYVKKSELTSDYYNKGDIDAKLDKKADKSELANYLKTSAADNKYATKNELGNKADKSELTKYLATLDADKKYQPKGDYATNATLASKQKELEVKIKASQVVAGDGVNVNNQTVSVKIDPSSEGRFFSVGTDGLKFSGLLEMEEVIAASLNDLNTRIKKLEEKIARL